MSCKSGAGSQPYNPETLVTMYSENLTMSQSENGLSKYKMETPLMERYELAREPYSEYRKGIYVENFKDSTDVIQSTLKADYAVYYEKRSEWLAMGNVVATGQNDQTLYTEQLFWNEKSGRVYSNVESTVVQGSDVFVGEGFESDDKFDQWVFRNYTGRFVVNLDEEREESEGTAGEERPAGDTPGDGAGQDTVPTPKTEPKRPPETKKPEPMFRKMSDESGLELQEIGTEIPEKREK